jgi:hypothetical protein
MEYKVLGKSDIALKPFSRAMPETLYKLVSGRGSDLKQLEINYDTSIPSIGPSGKLYQFT